MSILHFCPRLILAALALAGASGTAAAQTSFDKTLKPYLAKYELPALAAVVVHEGKVIASGVVGTRKVGAAIPVTLHDRWHIGSDSKAITSLVAATLVEQGALKWTTTLPDVFPELSEKMAPELRSATLEQFLCHVSGLAADTDAVFDLLGRATLRENENVDEQRYWVLKEWSPRPVPLPPGKKWAYSNMGYVFAGAMMERVTRQSWEALVTERIFVPLKLQTAGFGPQVSLGKIDAPLPHVIVDGKLKSLTGGPGADNPATGGPAGTAYMSALDFARWAGWNAGGGKRGPRIVTAETLKKLHTPLVSIGEREDAAPGTPPIGKYGFGWVELKLDFMPEPILFHGGSNEKNLAHVFFDPKRDRAMVIVTNVGGKKADEGVKALGKELYLKYLSPSASGK